MVHCRSLAVTTFITDLYKYAEEVAESGYLAGAPFRVGAFVVTWSLSKWLVGGQRLALVICPCDR